MEALDRNEQQKKAATSLDIHSTGDFSTAATVVFLVGNSLRRLHAFWSIMNILDSLDHPFTGLTATLKKDELEFMKSRTPLKNGTCEHYSLHTFQEAYKKHQIASTKKAFIIIEMDFNLLSNISFPQHEVQTLLLTDFTFSDPDTPAFLEERIISQMRRSSLLQTIVYNYDIGQFESQTQSSFHLRLDDIPIRTHYSFGKTTDSLMQFSEKGNTLLTAMPNLQLTLPFDPHSTVMRKEGYFAAVGLLLAERVLNHDVSFHSQPASPWLEEQISPKLTALWAKYSSRPEEIQSIIERCPRLCMSLSVYLRFEQTIENSIADIERVVVVAEEKSQEAVFSEYFVQKEKDSYHTIVFIPDAAQLPDLLSAVAGEEEFYLLFDDLRTYQYFFKSA
ncbi:MAG: hypothetical protein ACK4NC_00855 [Candidatus Gracilibacteria bacterium]